MLDKPFSPNESVVMVYVTRNTYDYSNPWAAPTQEEGTGSGFIIEGKRIVTNAHVIADCSFVQVRKAGSSIKYEASVKRVMHSVDLAILEISCKRNMGNKMEEFFENTKPLALGQTPRVGDTVRAYGFPVGGNEMSLTKGVVSRVEMNFSGHTYSTVGHTGIALMILSCDMDTATTYGNSGGPVMSIPGDNILSTNAPLVEPTVVGVSFQGWDSKEGGYMIAVEVLKKAISLDDVGETLIPPNLGVLTQILENPSLRKSLGLKGHTHGNTDVVKMEDIKRPTNGDIIKNNNTNMRCQDCIQPDKIEIIDRSKDIEGGIMVTKVGSFSPVNCVLRKRDVLLQIDDFKIGENGTVEFRKGERTDWTYCISRKCIGESILLKFFRDSRIYTYTIKLDKTKGDLRYYGEKVFDVKPHYLIKGGLVFQPLTLNLCSSLDIDSDVEAKLLQFRSKANPGYVLLTKILQNESTTGYDMKRQIVTLVNGNRIHTMEDLIDAFKEDEVKDDINIKSTKKEKEHCIELESEEVIILISNNLEEDTKDIACRYDIQCVEYLG